MVSSTWTSAEWEKLAELICILVLQNRSALTGDAAFAAWRVAGQAGNVSVRIDKILENICKAYRLELKDIKKRLNQKGGSATEKQSPATVTPAVTRKGRTLQSSATKKSLGDTSNNEGKRKRIEAPADGVGTEPAAAAGASNVASKRSKTDDHGADVTLGSINDVEGRLSQLQ